MNHIVLGKVLSGAWSLLIFKYIACIPFRLSVHSQNVKLIRDLVQDSTTEVGYKSFHCINDCCQSLDNKEINMRGPGTSEEIQGSKDIKFLLRNLCRCH